MENNEDLIVIRKSSSKKTILKILVKVISIASIYDSIMATFWAKVFDKDSRLKLLTSNYYIRLVFNTILLGIVAMIFGGTIEMILFYCGWINIAAVLIGKMNWVEKLKKS